MKTHFQVCQAEGYQEPTQVLFLFASEKPLYFLIIILHTD